MARMIPKFKFRNYTHAEYTRLVKTLRVALPITAVFMLAIVVIWPHFDPAQAPKRHESASAPEMTHSHFAGIDKHNRPFTITADKAVQQKADSNDLDLTNPLAEITMQSGSWVSLRANQGQYHEDPGIIDLQGDVRLFHDQGYEVATSAAVIDLEQNVAWSDQPTEGHGPRAYIKGDGFRMFEDGNKIIFLGHSRLILKPEPEETGPEDSVSANADAPAAAQ